MSKMVIKNKLKLPKELDEDTPFRYQFIVKPHSYNKKLPLTPNMTTEEFTYNFKIKPLLEFKYRECYFFEKLFSSLCFFNTRDIERLINPRNNYKDFSYRVHQVINTGENRRLILEHDDSGQRFNCNFKQCYYADNSYHLDYIFNTSNNLNVSAKKHDFTIVHNNSYGINPDNNHTINSMFKYLNDDIDNIEVKKPKEGFLLSSLIYFFWFITLNCFVIYLASQGIGGPSPLLGIESIIYIGIILIILIFFYKGKYFV